MTIRILADREPYASFADVHASERMKGPSGPFIISTGPIPDEEPPPDLIAMPVEEFLAMPPVRRSGSVVFAYGGVSGMEEAFALGCLDYLREPWSLRELTARAGKLASPRLCFRGIEISLIRDHLNSPCASVRLSEGERRLARLLILNAGYPVPREALGFAIQGNTPTKTHAIENQISSLRAKLDQICAGAHEMIKSVRGLGYRLTL